MMGTKESMKNREGIIGYFIFPVEKQVFSGISQADDITPALRTCFKNVVASGSSARRPERISRSVLDVHEDFEYRATQQ